MTIRTFALAAGLCLATQGLAAAQGTPTLGIDRTPSGAQIALGTSAPFHSTSSEVQNARLLALASSDTVVAVWEEQAQDGSVTPWYGISLDGGASFAKVTQTSYDIGMVHGGAFDPLVSLPAHYSDSPLQGVTNVYLVQYHTQVIDAYSTAVGELGGEIVGHVVNHTNFVRMTPEVRDQVAELAVVRAVVPYHYEYRAEEWILDRLGSGEIEGTHPYNIWTWSREAGDPASLQAKIEALGGEVRDISDRSSLVGAMLNESQLLAVLALDEVVHIDRYSELEPDLDIVRQFSGADYLQGQTGFSGQGVRGEVADTGIVTSHQGFQHNGGVLMHGSQSGSTSHGTNVHGVVFGDGTGSASGGTQGIGILPNAKGIFADADSFGWLNNTDPTNRANHTAELVDPLDVYRGLFQTNSTGSNRTANYTTISANMDQIVLDNDVIICQSQSNAGTTQSRPEAWGKNMMGIGGIKHQDTLTRADDNWTFGGSIGPATDGRIKPDLAHYYDNIYTASSSGGYTCCFGGTSGATPCTVGHFGLFFQMWHNDVFNNNPTGGNPFQSKCHFETAKAALINTAVPWDFSGATHDLTRVHQGFGAANVQYMYDMRDKTVFRDRQAISNLQTEDIVVNVAAGEPQLKVTMVYRDLPGVVGVDPHRVNDISLRVTSPGGSVYYGNVGLTRANESLAGGSWNTVDTVENVWVSLPAAGAWTVSIVGADINTNPDTGAAGSDADFSLWITGANEGCSSSNFVNYCTAGTSASGCQSTLSSVGVASASAASGFVVTANNTEGNVNGQFFWGTSGRQANPWGNGTSYNCVIPPVKRGGITAPSGTNGGCNGKPAQDLNARWNSKPAQNPGAGATVQIQYWYRDPFNTSNQTTSLSDGGEFTVCP